MKVSRVCLFLVALVESVAWGTLPKTPYDAIVIQNEVYARSGPGQQMYYPTSMLKKGDRVTVRRHDPGGWFMIDPPSESFSWIATEFVRKEAGNRATVTENNFVRIGSALGDHPHSIRHLLVAGERVEILGQETLQTERGSVPMYKIKPPQGEYRWISGAAVVPTGKESAAAINTKPSVASKMPAVSGDLTPPPKQMAGKPMPAADTPRSPSKVSDNSKHTLHPENTENHLVERPLVRITKKGTYREDAPASTARDVPYTRLEELDSEFRRIIHLEMSQWDFSQLEQQYRALLDTETNPAFSHQVQLRLDAVERYKTKQKEYVAFVRLTEETTRRDGELLALRRNSAVKPETTIERPRVSPPPTSEPRSGTLRNQRRFDGAGIIQRSALPFIGAPRHVLVAPDGRILTYLQATPPLNLDRYVGRSMGLFGQRYYRPDLRTDFLIVRNLVPVRLKP